MLQNLQNLQLDGGLGSDNLVGRRGSLLSVSNQRLDLLSIKLVWLEGLDGRDGQLVAWLNGSDASRNEVLLGLTALGDDLQHAGSQLLDDRNVIGQNTQVSVDGWDVDLLHLRVGVQCLVRKSQGQLQGIGTSALGGVSSSNNVGRLSGDLAEGLSEHCAGWSCYRLRVMLFTKDGPGTARQRVRTLIGQMAEVRLGIGSTGR